MGFVKNIVLLVLVVTLGVLATWEYKSRDSAPATDATAAGPGISGEGNSATADHKAAKAKASAEEPKDAAKPQDAAEPILDAAEPKVAAKIIDDAAGTEEPTSPATKSNSDSDTSSDGDVGEEPSTTESNNGNDGNQNAAINETTEDDLLVEVVMPSAAPNADENNAGEAPNANKVDADKGESADANGADGEVAVKAEEKPVPMGTMAWEQTTLTEEQTKIVRSTTAWKVKYTFPIEQDTGKNLSSERVLTGVMPKSVECDAALKHFAKAFIEKKQKFEVEETEPSMISSFFGYTKSDVHVVYNEANIELKSTLDGFTESSAKEYCTNVVAQFKLLGVTLTASELEREIPETATISTIPGENGDSKHIFDDLAGSAGRAGFSTLLMFAVSLVVLSAL